MVKLSCPYINQREKYPTGCESVTAVMLLQALGYFLTVEEFIDGYLPMAPEPYRLDGQWYGENPRQFYLGNPYTEDGWGCFAPALKKGIDRYTGKETVTELQGETLDALTRFTDAGIPVIVFATMGMAQPRDSLTWITPAGESYTWKTPMHCLLLTGYDDSFFYFHDPLEKEWTPYPRKASEYAFKTMGADALILRGSPRGHSSARLQL